MAKKGGNNDNHDYKGLIDFIIKEEGFLKKPTDIGDGKITLGSGLTDPKWHKLYKERGNKWSAEDNRKAVEEEVKTREKYLSDSFPNWGLLPKRAQEALIAYNYNYNFTPSNSPRMYKAAAAKDFKELGNQINATSKDPKFKNGLEDRRERERDYYFSGFSTPEVAPVIPVPVPVTETPKVIFTEQPDAIRNYRQPVTPSNTRRDAYKAMQDKVNFNRFMNSISIQNTLPPAYEPQSNLHSEGGQMETVKLWEELSIPEKAAMMRVAVKNGITNLQDIKREYNEFAKGGPKKKPSVNGNAQRAMDYFMNKGLSQHQAAGLVGNLMRESGMSPTAVNSSSGAYGLAQWLGSRKKALFNKYGNNPTLNQQLDFVWNELNSTHKKGLKALKSSKSAEEAARNAMGYYEFMAGPDAAVREMRKYGQDGEGSMRKGINYASILMGHSPSKSPIAPINPSISQESLESPIPFTPFNPEAFFATPETYQQPIVVEEPEAQESVAISPYSPEEIERQERMNRLSTFNRILSLTNPYPQEEDSFLSTIGLLTGNTFSKGGKIYIKPSHRGRLTELKKRTGKSEAELYKTGGPAVRKMITFARNARKWKHGLGGNLFDDGGSYSYTKPLDNVIVDKYGNLLDPNVPSARGTLRLPDLEVTANPLDVGRGKAARLYNDYGIASNDATSTPLTRNIHLNERGLDGATKAAAWMKNNPTLNNIGMALGAVPFAVAGYPAFMTAGEGAAAALANPYVDAGLTSYFGAHGLQKLANGEADWTTALEIAPLGRLAKPIYEGVVQPGMRLFNSPLTGNWTKIGNKEYRLSPSSLGANGSPLESKPFIQSYEIENLPGYQLRNLMRGNPLEKQLSKTGTISRNNIETQAAKGSAVEKAIIDKVLSSEQFAGQKAVDYNAFRQAIQKELITYDRVPSELYQNYGADKLGYTPPKELLPTEEGGVGPIAFMNEWQVPYEGVSFNTYTFESPRIPLGNGKHYSKETLGHSRTYTTEEEPNVLHVMESQSDWAQNKPSVLKDADIRNLQDLEDEINFQRTNGDTGFIGISHEDYMRELEKARAFVDPEQSYLINNYLRRQMQENLKYAAEHGQTKMRYPTRETAVKIEGYKPISSEPAIGDTPYFKYIDDLKMKLEEGENLSAKEIAKINSEIKRIQKIEARWKAGETTFDPKLETILDKYSDYPKQYNKLYKDAEVRTVTDSKGNTWYEVDVPEDYLNQEWQYRNGGLLNKH